LNPLVDFALKPSNAALTDLERNWEFPFGDILVDSRATQPGRVYYLV
jgi:hypothetical protein